MAEPTAGHSARRRAAADELGPGVGPAPEIPLGAVTDRSGDLPKALHQLHGALLVDRFTIAPAV
jgi:hypothetical protein